MQRPEISTIIQNKNLAESSRYKRGPDFKCHVQRVLLRFIVVEELLIGMVWISKINSTSFPQPHYCFVEKSEKESMRSRVNEF